MLDFGVCPRKITSTFRGGSTGYLGQRLGKVEPSILKHSGHGMGFIHLMRTVPALQVAQDPGDLRVPEGTVIHHWPDLLNADFDDSDKIWSTPFALLRLVHSVNLTRRRYRTIFVLHLPRTSRIQRSSVLRSPNHLRARQGDPPCTLAIDSKSRSWLLIKFRILYGFRLRTRIARIIVGPAFSSRPLRYHFRG